MAGGTVGFPRRMSALSGHFPASSLSEETRTTTNGMNSLDPVTYPSEKASSRAAKTRVQDSEGIDHTCQKLFECMSIAYKNSAKMEAPQFKAYKGLRISVKEKMRLNNIVWREWYLQFGEKRNNKKRVKICHFTAQMEHIHNKPTCVVLEGKYWKRSNEVVKNEYMKWRVFFKERMKHWKPDNAHVPDVELLDRVARDGHQTISTFVRNQNIRAHYSPPDLSKDDYKMDLTDDIFSTLQSVGFPHQSHRDLLHLESSDLIQPELIGLEPDLYLTDMEATEPLQELLADVMSIHMDTRFSTGQKRPGFQEHMLLTDTNRVTPPPAYPAMKRSRSSTLQAAAIDTTEESSDSFIDKIMTDSNIHPSPGVISSPSLLPEPIIAVHNSQQSPYNSSFSPSDDFPSFAQVNNGSTSHNNILSPDNLFDAHVQTSVRYNEPHFSSVPACSCYEQARLAGKEIESCVHSEVARQGLQATVQRGIATTHAPIHNHSLPYYKSSSADSYQSQTNGYAPVSSAASFNQSSDCYGMTSLSTASKPRLNSAASGGFNGSNAHRLNGSGVNGSGHGSVTVQSEFKKPEARQSVAKPNVDEKSSFLTKLLKKPLDKETADAEVVASSLASTPIHSVYFPSFTPITYTPQVATTNNAGCSQGKSASGKESAASAEEEKREAQTAERKRRIQIKTGFDALAGLVPTIATNTTTKTSKATMLTKTLEFIDKLQTEEKQMQDEMDLLTNEITALDHSISLCHGQLPATGVPTLSHHKDHMTSILKSYMAEQASKNWKFYVFSKLAEPLFDSFYNMVSTASLEDLYRSTQAWLDQYGSLASLRPALSDSLREICTETSILTDPSKFADEARDVLSHGADFTSHTPSQPSVIDHSLLPDATAEPADFNLPAAASTQYSAAPQPASQAPASLNQMRPPSSYKQPASQVPAGYRMHADPLTHPALGPNSCMGPPANYRSNASM